MGTGNFQSRMGSLTRFLTRGTPALETPCERTDLILELVPTRSHVQIPKTASILLSFWHKVSRLTAWHLAFNSKQAHASSRNGVLHHRKDNCWMENTWSGGFYTPPFGCSCFFLFAQCQKTPRPRVPQTRIRRVHHTDSPCAHLARSCFTHSRTHAAYYRTSSFVVSRSLVAFKLVLFLEDHPVLKIVLRDRSVGLGLCLGPFHSTI